MVIRKAPKVAGRTSDGVVLLKPASKPTHFTESEIRKAVKTVKAGRPSSGKQVVSIRLDPDVIAKFKATGPGWQARMNEVLKDTKL